MGSNHDHDGAAGGRGNAAARSAPDWADGLKQLYDSVVEEDLPDSFKDLLDRLEGIASPNPDNGVPAPATGAPSSRKPSR
jgi:hypothetical protein